MSRIETRVSKCRVSKCGVSKLEYRNVEYRNSSNEMSSIEKSSIEKSKFESRESIKSAMQHKSLMSFFSEGVPKSSMRHNRNNSSIIDMPGRHQCKQLSIEIKSWGSARRY